jgi:maltose acetyltransferase-like protein
MIAGEPYLASDSELVTARSRSRKICRAFNGTDDEEADRRRELLRRSFRRHLLTAALGIAPVEGTR